MRLMFAPRGSGTTERLKFAPHLAPRLLRIDAARLGCGMSMLTPTHPGAGGTPRNGLMAVDVAGVVDLAEQLDRASVGRARNGEPGDQLAASSSAEALHHTLRDFRDRPPPTQPVGTFLHTGPEPAVAVGFDRGAGEVSPAGCRRKMAGPPPGRTIGMIRQDHRTYERKRLQGDVLGWEGGMASQRS